MLKVLKLVSFVSTTVAVLMLVSAVLFGTNTAFGQSPAPEGTGTTEQCEASCCANLDGFCAYAVPNVCDGCGNKQCKRAGSGGNACTDPV